MACYHNVLAQTVPWSGTALTGNTHRLDNVGIGLSGPTHLLHLEKAGGDQGIFVNSLERSAYLRLSSNNNGPVDIYTPNSSADLRFLVGGADRMTINTSGNVGIGTVSPAHTLHLERTGIQGIFVNSTDNAAFLRLSSNNDRPVEIYSPNNSPDLRFKVNNDDRMTINSSGNVGIGTVSPTQRLELSTGNLKLADVSGGTTGNLLIGGVTFSGGEGMRLFGGELNFSGSIDVKTNSLTKGLTFRVDNTNGGTERMRITAEGRVGIGTANPEGELDIVSYISNAKPSIRMTKDVQGTDVRFLTGIASVSGDYLNLSQPNDIVIKGYGDDSKNLFIANESSGNDIILSTFGSSTQEVFRVTGDRKARVLGRFESGELGSVLATGLYSAAFGSGKAIGDYSAAFSGSEVIGVNSFAANNSRADGNGSSAFTGGRANGDFSFAVGESSFATGNRTISAGSSNNISSTASIGIGQSLTTDVLSTNSTLIGGRLKSISSYTLTLGFGDPFLNTTLENNVPNSLMIGMFNRNDATNSNKPLPTVIVTPAPSTGSTFGSVGIGTINPFSTLSINGNLAIGNAYASSISAPDNGLIVEGNVGIGTSTVLSGTKANIFGSNEHTLVVRNQNTASPAGVPYSAITGEMPNPSGSDGPNADNNYYIGVKGVSDVGIEGQGKYTGIVARVFGGVNNTTAMLSKNLNSGSVNYGIWTEVQNASELNYAIYAKAEGTTGANYGVYTKVTGTGSSSSSPRYAIWADNGGIINSNFSWAGYFNGRTGRSGSDFLTCDRNLKEKIQPVEYEGDILDKINVYSYEFKKDLKSNIALEPGYQVGFIAQEIESVFPHLVKDILFPAKYSDEGKVINPGLDYKGLNLDGLVPILWGIVKSQNDRINELAVKQQIINQEKGIINEKKKSYLMQNYPNPWDRETTIGYELPEGCKSAMIMITDMVGSSISQFDLNIQENKLVIQSGLFKSGTYIYLLVADGVEIDSKKMIVTN
jgi:hypothetical protein